MPETRQRFHEELAELERQTLDGLDLVIQQLDRSLESLSYQDVELAGMVVADDDRIDGRYLEVHQGILSLLARQAPVAGDLRIVAALLHVIRCVERMGDQCVNIAKLISLSGFEPAKGKDILDAIERMGRLTRSLVSQAKESFAERDATAAQDLVRQDGEINRLNRAIFTRTVEIGDDLELREWAMFMILVARAIEPGRGLAVDEIHAPRRRRRDAGGMRPQPFHCGCNSRLDRRFRAREMRASADGGRVLSTSPLTRGRWARIFV